MGRFFGRHGRRKVNVPDLSGLTRSQAQTSLTDKGLNYSESATSTDNISLGLSVANQGTAAGTTVLYGDTVSFSYYNYIAPPTFNPGFNPGFGPSFTPAQDSSVSSSSWNGSTVTVNGSFPTAPTNIAVNGTNISYGSWSHSGSQITFPLSGEGSRSIQIYNGRTPLIPEFTVSYSSNPGFSPGFSPGFTPDFSNPGFSPGFTPDFSNPGFSPGFTPDFSSPGFDVGPGFDITLTSLDLSSLFDFGGGKSVGVTTLVRTTDGLVKAGDLKVGDTLLSANIEGLPYENSDQPLSTTLLSWSEDNPNIIPEVTTIVNLYKTQSAFAVVINQDVFSQYHYILIQRDGIAKFETSVNIIPETDLVYSYTNSNWEPIYLYEVIPVAHDIVSINCEPYDMFFTERMLTHDSSAI
jgi:hypothetical protein